ncbi:hypothetical protein HUJ05_001784 [Dendroctonus ponderosae]|nr:hypothetical protein HUJ05_001784 [Dendroctonus ponderosae]
MDPREYKKRSLGPSMEPCGTPHVTENISPSAGRSITQPPKKIMKHEEITSDSCALYGQDT